MSTTAISRTLAIPELFESILHHTDLKDLLLAQRVCRHWHAFITASPTLQEALFFKPVSTNRHPQHALAPQLNPLLSALFPPLFSLVNPTWDGLNAELLNFWDEEWPRDQSRRSTILRADASWRRMLPVQPAAKLEHLEIISIDGCVHRFDRYPCKLGERLHELQKDGLRMGMLYDLVAQMDGLHVGVGFFVHWEMFALGPPVPYENAMDEYMDPAYIEDWELRELKNTITLHHMSNSYCDGGHPKGPSPLYMESPVALMLDEEPAGLLEFTEGVPPKYYTGWTKFVKRKAV